MSGDPVEINTEPLVLSVDFTHTIEDVELALHYHTQLKMAVQEPKCISIRQHLLTVVREQEKTTLTKVSEISIVASSSQGRYII